MIYPDRLKKEATIGVTATSGGCDGEKDLTKLEYAISNLAKEGYKVVLTDNVKKCEKLVSSSGEQRTKEFYDLWCDENIDMIIAASGGEFLMEVLPHLNRYHLEDKNAKWVQGFSDTSVLNYYITTKYDIATIHGANFGAYGRKQIHPSYLKSFEVASCEKEIIEESYEMYEAHPIHWQEGMEFEMPRPDTKVEYKNLYGENEVKVSGRIIGGCMDALRTLVGTSYDYTKSFCDRHKEGIIWYLENCEMSVTDIYRTLWQMREAGWFDNAKAILIGRTMSSEAVHEFTYKDALHSAFDSLNIPVIYDIDVGHTALQWAIINGSKATFEYKKGKGKITQTKI